MKKEPKAKKNSGSNTQASAGKDSAPKERQPKETFEPLITSGSHKGKRRCQRYTSSGKQCGHIALTGYDCCAQRHSAGKGGRKITTGKRSKYIPKMEAAIKEYLQDPELTGLRREISIVRFRQEEVIDAIKAKQESGIDCSAEWPKWDALTEQMRVLTIAENKRQAQLASNINARQANALRAVIISVIADVCKDESIARSQIPKLVGLKLIQQMS